ncbi:transporter associated domain-containing protein [Streptomyces sp. NPDC089915]|uniref:transporter associated domain-containing protein n=1 Tax=Streptomyces sp. NPDC089915 TaxID=3155186 RepID=UPI003441093B
MGELPGPGRATLLARTLTLGGRLRRPEGHQLACTVDEFTRTVHLGIGPVEVPDLIEAPEENGRRAYEASGSLHLDRLEELGLVAPEGPFETLAGLIADRLERVPAAGDTVTVAGWDLAVLDMEHHRADRVALTAPPPSDVGARSR